VYGVLYGNKIEIFSQSYFMSFNYSQTKMAVYFVRIVERVQFLSMTQLTKKIILSLVVSVHEKSYGNLSLSRSRFERTGLP
jgi:hypothetical protein